VSTCDARPFRFINAVFGFSWDQFVVCFPTWVKEETSVAGEIRMQISKFMNDTLVVSHLFSIMHRLIHGRKTEGEQ
jgi:hypothetical protein